MVITEASVREYVRCSVCRKPVLKQKYCPRCGNVLIKEPENQTTLGEENAMDNKTLEKPVETVVEANKTDQFNDLSQKAPSSEDEKRVALEKESSKTVGKEDPSESGTITTPVEPMTVTVPDVVKNVNEVSSLVNLLKEDKMNEDGFLGMYNSMADDAHKLTIRRGELITEIEAAVKDYRSKVISVQRGMKLLNIRARAAALRRDIDEYTRWVGEEDKEAVHLGDLEKLNDSIELEKIMAAVNNCTDALSVLKVNEEVKGKMQSSMQEALSWLKETNKSQ